MRRSPVVAGATSASPGSHHHRRRPPTWAAGAGSCLRPPARAQPLEHPRPPESAATSAWSSRLSPRIHARRVPPASPQSTSRACKRPSGTDAAIAEASSRALVAYREEAA